MESNFFAKLRTKLTKEQIAKLFTGWEVFNEDGRYEISCTWADVELESHDPILVNGLLSDIKINGDNFVSQLKLNGIHFSAEAYDDNDNLYKSWRWDG